MSNEREAMLGRIRQSLGTAVLPSARATIPPRPPSPALDPTVLADSFAREAMAVAGHGHRPTTNAEAIETVIGLLREAGDSSTVAGTKEIIAWADEELPLPGLGEAIRSAGFTCLDPTLPSEPPARRERLADLARASAGLTGALAGLADTGSLVLLSGAGRPRLASLLPPVHIALLPVQAIYPSLTAFFKAHPAAARSGSNLVLITGPSRSADIELTLTLGVHGPKTLHVVLLPVE